METRLELFFICFVFFFFRYEITLYVRSPQPIQDPRISTLVQMLSVIPGMPPAVKLL